MQEMLNLNINQYFINEENVSISYLFLFQQILSQDNQLQKQAQIYLLKSNLNVKNKILLLKRSQIFDEVKEILISIYDFQQTIFIQQFDQFLKIKDIESDIYDTVLHEFLNVIYQTARQYILNLILMKSENIKWSEKFIQFSLLKALDQKKYFTIYKYIEVLVGNIHMQQYSEQQDNLEYRLTQMSVEIVRRFYQQHQHIKHHVNQINIFQNFVYEAFQKLNFKFTPQIIENIENCYMFVVVQKLQQQMLNQYANRSIQSYLLYITDQNQKTNKQLQDCLFINIEECKHIKNNIFNQYLRWKQQIINQNIKEAKNELNIEFFTQQYQFLYDAINTFNLYQFKNIEDIQYVIDVYLQLNDGDNAFINCFHYLVDNELDYMSLVQQQFINLLNNINSTNENIITLNVKQIAQKPLNKLLTLIKDQSKIPLFTISYYQQNICTKLLQILSSDFNYVLEQKQLLNMFQLLNDRLDVSQAPQVNILVCICLSIKNYDIQSVKQIFEQIISKRYQQSARVQLNSMCIIGYILLLYYNQLQDDIKSIILDYISQQVLSSVQIISNNCISLCQHLIQQNIKIEFGIMQSKIQQYRIEKLTLFQLVQREIDNKIFKLNYKESFSSKQRAQMSDFQKVTQNIKIGDDEVEQKQKQKHFVQTKISVQQMTSKKVDNNLVLILSLLQNPINIAGIVRTAEIFNCNKIYVNGKDELFQNQQFITQCVNSEKHIQIDQIQVQEINQKLKDFKQQQYQIIALEQSVNSIMLDQFKWPNKAVLILGNERSGIPNDIMQLCDHVVEIPQFGQTRSLNVHVSASLALWEYIKQFSQIQ